MRRTLIPILAFTLLSAASGCAPQPDANQQAAPANRFEKDSQCLPPGPCEYPGGGEGGFLR